MHFLYSIAEEKIQESIRRGEFDDLPGAGKPLPPDDAAYVPEELRIGYRMLKNAGLIPEEMQLRKDLLTLGDLLAACQDEEERAKIRKDMSAKKLRYQALMSRRGWSASSAYNSYEADITRKLT